MQQCETSPVAGRARLRWRENLDKCYLIRVADFNLGILMRALSGCGTPREAASAAPVVFFVFQTDNMLLFASVARAGDENAALLIAISTDIG